MMALGGSGRESTFFYGPPLLEFVEEIRLCGLEIETSS
jgi:hypothetical protein